MDLDKILHFVPAHIEQIIAVLVGLFSVTTILLLIRSLSEKSEKSDSGVDVRTIEGALKRVLAQTPPTVVEKTIETGNPSNIADLAPLKNALAEKEKQLAALNSELKEAKAAAAAAAQSGSPSSAAAAEVQGSATALAALELEISDLKARLTEYEIIEDDIADLALYKEENARLRREIEEARSATPPAAAAPAAPPILEANPAAGIPGLTEALEEEAAAKSVEVKTSQPPAAPPQPQPQTQAPVEAPAPKAADQPEGLLEAFESIDTDKMLKEAEQIASTPEREDPEINALSDLLDTDKLLEEVNSLDAQDVMSEFKDKSKMG